MKACILVDVNVVDLELVMQYVEGIPDLIAKHGGPYLVRGVEPTVVEGASLAPK